MKEKTLKYERCLVLLDCIKNNKISPEIKVDLLSLTQSSTEDININCNQAVELIKDFDNLINKCNIGLIKKWEEEKNLKVKCISEFLRKYQDNIFTRKQLINMFEMMGISNPEKYHDNIRSKNKEILYIKKSEMLEYIKEFKNIA